MSDRPMSHTRRAAGLAAAGGLLAALAAAPAAYAARAPQPRLASLTVDLVCSGDGTGTNVPPETNTNQPETMTGTGTLKTCFSPNGTLSAIKSGTITSKMTGTSGCGDTAPLSGSITFTWFDAAGTKVGTTTVNYTDRQQLDQTDDETNAFVQGTATLGSSVLPLAGNLATYEPTTPLNCTTGISTVGLKVNTIFYTLLS